MTMEIKFKRDTAFRKQFFVPNSFAHPAKMDAQLLIWITEHYTEVGETILDPMAGSGTLMLACGLGRNVVLVELEEKFCKMMLANWNEVKMRPQLGYTMGDCQIIQGDARNLGGVLADRIITSPPYSDMSMGGGLNTKPPREGRSDQSGRSSKTPSQEGAGKYDKIITSPPYAETGASGPTRSPFWDRLASDPTSARYGRKEHPSVGEGYSADKNNIGNLPYGEIDKIITSPPYEGSIAEGNENFEGMRHLGTINKDNIKDKRQQLRAHQFDKKDTSYSVDKDNIGNLKSQSYLEAMALVYSRCHKVLKSEGLMILVTKNFIRNKKVIRLDTDTIKLCKRVGFTYLERHYRKLPSQSFWRVIYHQKHPEVEQINHEDVLVFSK